MAEERRFSMLKPGVLQRRIVGEVLSRLEAKGFRIIGLKMMRVSRQLAETHYREHRDKAFFGELVDYICSAPLIALVLEADGAVAMLRHLCGATKADQAAPGTIRGDFALHTNFNIIHASDSHESAEREIGLFFRPEEIFDWEDCNHGWI
jgi:nucleoside-diphosphate kinase